MTRKATIQLGDIGTILRLTVEDDGTPVDISSASTLAVVIDSPTAGDAAVQKTAVFTTDGTDGQLQYVTQSGDLDTVGTWSIQGYIIMDSGTFHTSVKKFEVKSNLS